MADQLGLRCPDHPDLADSPDVVVVRSSGVYQLRIRDGGSSFVAVSFCPWCGVELPREPGALRQQWPSDSDILARIGQRLFATDPSATVLLPAELAQLAVEAWERDEDDELPEGESQAERIERSHAAVLALIGIEVSERGNATGSGISVDVSAWLIGSALDAADRANLLL